MVPESALPHAPADIDPAWLTEALAPRHPGARVRAVEVREMRQVTNTHAFLHIDYEDECSAPSEMFCKMLPLDPERREILARSEMGPREVLFYNDLRPHLPAMRVPAIHVAIFDARDQAFVILMEDLAHGGCAVPDGTWGIAPNAAAVALEELAELHVRFESPQRRAAEAPWVPLARNRPASGLGLLQFGLDNHRDKLSDQFVACTDVYLRRHAEMVIRWADGPGPATVIHGDPHLGNLFVDHGRVGFLDWGVINVSTPIRDAGYFITMAMQVEDRRVHERDLLRHYLDMRVSKGGAPIGFDEAWLAHRFHSLYCVPAACQIVTFPDNATPRRRVFAAAFLERVEAALEDLDPLGALRELERREGS
jgi:Phosphotransferase enzyme family